MDNRKQADISHKYKRFHSKICPCFRLLVYQIILIMKCDQKGIGFYLIWYTNVALSTVFSYYCMHLLASGRYQPLLLGSVGELYPYLSIYLFVHVSLRWILEQLDGKSESLENAEKCLDKVINNCILYMAIFSRLLCSGRYQDIYTEGLLIEHSKEIRAHFVIDLLKERKDRECDRSFRLLHKI